MSILSLLFLTFAQLLMHVFFYLFFLILFFVIFSYSFFLSSGIIFIASY